MLALDSGQIWWSHDMSSYRGMAADEENIYVTQSDGVIVAMRQRDGSELWRNEKLRRRAESAPVVTSSAVVIADFQGYVHFLDKNTGALVARVKAAKQRVSSAPAADGDTVVVLTDGGSLVAFRAAPKAPAPAASAEPAPASPPGPSAEPAPASTPSPSVEPAPAPPPAPSP
jgi:outer membrane protein assembly factor BamB